MYVRSVLCLGLLCCILCCAGCSQKIKTHGTVKFPDGTPLEKGTVFFSNGIQMFQGEIQSNGTFKIGEIRDGDGIPPGKYKIWISANTQDYVRDAVTKEITNKMMRQIVIDPKYESRETSDLTFEVKPGGSKSIDIVVEKP